MKTNKRLAAAADFRNHPAGYLVLDITEWDGGEFDLQPQYDDSGTVPVLYLPSTDAPGYRVAITAQNVDTLDRLGKALTALARRAKGAEADSDNE